MSGNSKQRRQYRRKLARQGLTYVPPSDYRRRLLAPDVYLELPSVFSSYTYPPLTWPRLAMAQAAEAFRAGTGTIGMDGRSGPIIHVHDEIQVHVSDPVPAVPSWVGRVGCGWYGGERPKLTLAETIAGMDAPVVAEDGGASRRR